MEAVDCWVVSHPDLALALTNLGIALSKRFERLAALEDLYRTIDAFDKALDSTPDGHRDRAIRLNNLGACLIRRFERAQQFVDIENAVNRCSEAVKLTQLNEPDGAIFSNNLGVALRLQYSYSKKIEHLNWVIEADEESLISISVGHSERPMYQSNLGNALREVSSPTALSIDRFTKIDPDARGCGKIYSSRTSQSSKLLDQSELRLSYSLCFSDFLIEDFDALVAALEEAAELTAAPPTTRILAARHATEILHFLDMSKAGEILQKAMDLLPSTCPISVLRTGQPYLVSEFSGLATYAAAFTLECGKPPPETLAMLDAGRAIMMGRLLDIRDDVKDIPSEFV